MPAEINIPFPLGGIDRRVAFQESNPQTTFYAVNVFPDSTSGRARGGSRPGLTKRFTNQLTDSPQFMLSLVTVNQTPYRTLVIGTTINAYQSQAVASGTAGSIEYTESLTALSADLEVADGDPLQIETGEALVVTEYNIGTVSRGTLTTYQGKLVIASSGTVLSEGTGTLTDGRLSSDDVADWTALGIDLQIHTVELYGDVSATYEIQDVNTNSITVANLTTSGSVTYKIVDGPKLLDFDNQIFENFIPTSGYVPTGATAMVVFRDRLVWGVGRGWFMSRVGDINDYDYGADAEDLGRAVAAVNSDAGQPGDPIIAMAAGGYDYLVMFGEDSTWVLRGDPLLGGQLYPLSRTIGCVDTSAWCEGQSNEIYFLSKNGLYRIPPSVDTPPVPLSKEKMPRELQVAARDNYDTTLAYDSEDEAIAIFITPKDSEVGEHWWYDISTESFWKIDFQADHQPITALGFTGNPTEPRKLLILCRDGYVREFKGDNDDGDAIESAIVLGPYSLAESRDFFGIINEFRLANDTGSGDMTVGIYVGDTAEEAAESAQAGTDPFYSTTIGAGLTRTLRPRARGSAFCVRLSSSSSWAFELALAKIIASGMKRI